MVVHSCTLHPALALIGITVSEAADVADSFVSQLSSQVRLQKRISHAKVLREVRVTLALCSLYAAEGQVFHAVLVVGHLMVVMKPCIVGCAYLPSAGADTFLLTARL